MDNAKLLWDLELAKQPISVQVARPLSEMSETRNVSDLDIFFFLDMRISECPYYNTLGLSQKSKHKVSEVSCALAH